jgi:signal transduction histidine kinase/ActR/RegA family two-component response regulator
VKLISNRLIRFHIMLIAVIGGVSFLAYLNVIYSAAQTNRKDIDYLAHVGYPALDRIGIVLQQLPQLREKMTSAIGLGDMFLLEDADNQVRDLRQSLSEIRGAQPRFSGEVDIAMMTMDRYHQASRQLALSLLDRPLHDNQIKEQTDSINRLYRDVEERLLQLQHVVRDDYQGTLNTVSAGLDRSISVGLTLGIATVVVLVAFSALVSARVARTVQHSDRLKDEFLANVSHELRTPMHGIRGALELMDTQTMSAEQRQYWRAAGDAAEDMVRLVNDMLDFTDLQSGDLSHIERAFNLRQLVVGLAERYQGLCQRKGLAFYFSEDDTIDVDLVGDDQRIAHVVAHLLDNALKFTDTGSIRFAVHGDDSRNRNHDYALRFIVSDTGPGIPQGSLDMVFKPFRQLDGSHTRQYGGIGIGLPMCKQIVEMMGGALHYSHAPDHGSILTVSIPLSRARSESPQAESGLLTAGGASGPTRSGQTRVLVVEDNKVNQMVLKGFLQRLDCHVLTAANGREAIDIVTSEPVDLILMDCQMPVLDGYEATRLIRRLPEPMNRIPIVAVTANAHESDRKHCLDCGMDDYLKKPVDFDTIRRRIDRIRSPLALVKS